MVRLTTTLLLLAATTTECLADMADVSCKEDEALAEMADMSLLSVNLKLEKQNLHVEKQKHVQAPVVSSVLDNTRFMCWEGPEPSVGLILGTIRTTPLLHLHSNEAQRDGVTCASLGYSRRLAASDPCILRYDTSLWVTPVTTDREVQEFHSTSFGLLSTFAHQYSLNVSFVQRWAECSVCPGGMQPGSTGPRWWGVDTNQQCPENILAVAHQALVAGYRSPVASFLDDRHLVCNEGPMDYLTQVLSTVRQTPQRQRYVNATVSQQTCAQQGFGSLRDIVDECWPSSQKFMNAATENDDMGAFVGGNFEFFDVETAAGLRITDLTSCFSCQKGGANRDRGMLVARDGGFRVDLPRYNNEFCASIAPGACASGELGQELCSRLGL